MNFTPSSTGLKSATEGVPGEALAGQALQGQLGGGGAAAVVKDQVKSPGIALPDRSFARGSTAPPAMRAV